MIFHLSLILNKLKLIYKRKNNLAIMLIVIVFTISTTLISNTKSFNSLRHLFEHDLYFWLIILNSIVIIHKKAIFSSDYNIISRTKSRLSILINDYIVISISSFIIITIYLAFALILAMLLGNVNDLFKVENIIFLVFIFSRYNISAILIQIIIYLIYFCFPSIQKYSNAITFLPLLLLIILTSPYELLNLNHLEFKYLDFSAGNYFSYITNDKIDYLSPFFNNLHLISYLIFIICLSITFLNKRLEYDQNEA